MLARAGIDIVTIMLIGRWGSSAVRRYVQETPLLRATQIATKVFGNITQVHSIQTHKEDTSIKAELAALRDEIQTLKQPAWTEPKFIINPTSKISHIRATSEQFLSNDLWTTVCGWRYGISRFARAYTHDDRDYQCLKCMKPTQTITRPGLHSQAQPFELSSPDNSPAQSELEF